MSAHDPRYRDPDYQLHWRQANRDKVAAANRRFCERHPDSRKPLTAEQKAVRNERQKAYYREHRDEIIARAAARQATYDASDRGKEAKRRARENEKVRRPERIKARSAVSHALAAGRLVKKPCEICAAERVEAHHAFGYEPPMELAVWWLCPTHHGAIHRTEIAA